MTTETIKSSPVFVKLDAYVQTAYTENAAFHWQSKWTAHHASHAIVSRPVMHMWSAVEQMQVLRHDRDAGPTSVN